MLRDVLCDHRLCESQLRFYEPPPQHLQLHCLARLQRLAGSARGGMGGASAVRKAASGIQHRIELLLSRLRERGRCAVFIDEETMQRLHDILPKHGLQGKEPRLRSASRCAGCR